MIWNAPKVTMEMDEWQFRNVVAMAFKEIEEIVNGRIDSRNTREIGGYKVTLTSLESINGVVGLSSELTGGDDIRIWAGDANREVAAFRVYESGKMVATDGEFTGKITASDIEGGTITGALIQTALSGIYPRIELSSSENILTAYSETNNFIRMRPYFLESAMLEFNNGSWTKMYIFNTGFNNTFIIDADEYVDIRALNDITLSPVGFVRLSSWSKLKNDANGRTLQDEFNTINSRLAALESAVFAPP